MITWIPISQELPKVYKRVDDDGNKYESSNIILIWDGDEQQPLGIGCLEDGKFYIEGLVAEDAKYWAYVNTPDGYILQQEYMG